MKKRYSISICFLILLSCSIHANASEVYWTDNPVPPDLIVVGTLVEIEREAFESSGFPRIDGKASFMVHDSGFIKVEKRLFGDFKATRIPVSWISGSGVCATLDEPERRQIFKPITHYDGERRIWVLSNQMRFEMPRSEYYEFQDLPVDSIKKVKAEIKELKRRLDAF